MNRLSELHCLTLWYSFIITLLMQTFPRKASFRGRTSRQFSQPWLCSPYAPACLPASASGVLDSSPLTRTILPSMLLLHLQQVSIKGTLYTTVSIFLEQYLNLCYFHIRESPWTSHPVCLHPFWPQSHRSVIFTVQVSLIAFIAQVAYVLHSFALFIVYVHSHSSRFTCLVHSLVSLNKFGY